MEVAAYRERSVLGRKRAFGTRKAKTEVPNFRTVGNMPDTELVRQRYRSELVAVRELLEKANAALSSPSSPTMSPPRVVKHSRRRGFLDAQPRSDERPAKKIKASPSSAVKRKKMTRGERDLLAAGLAELASELPDHIIKLLKKHSRGISDGEMEIDINSVPDEALFELQQQLDEFVRARADPSRQEQQDGGMMAEEEDEDVDICGGVSPLSIASAPLSLAEEEDQYVDICGDASPVVMPKNLGDDAIVSGSPGSSTSTVWNSDSGSTSSDSDESVGSQESRAEQDAMLLFASAKEYRARCRAREKARQDVVETERTAMPSETVHPTVLKSLGIVEYDYDMAIPYSLLPRLGLFLMDDDDDQEQQLHPNFEENLEEGEIRQ